MALSFIGKPISLISHSDVRYRGILAGIDPAQSTIQLSKVYSMGTESRRPANEFIPPVQDPYEYIIFRASEVKDLAVDEGPHQTPTRNVHDDPAVLGAGAAQPPQAYPPYQQAPANAAAFAQQQSAQQRALQVQAVQQQQTPPLAASIVRGSQDRPRRANSNVHTAAASLETVERALGDLRVSNNSRQGGRRPNPHVAGQVGPGPKPISVPTTDFDFETSNARFNKKSLGKGGDDGSDVDTNPSDGEGESKEKAKESSAYHPKSSFFDELTPGPTEVRGGGRGGRGRGNGFARNRREEERERNVATFGEPGGVGLMGPGAYVGGWGGYGRRGGGRGGFRGGRGRGRGGMVGA